MDTSPTPQRKKGLGVFAWLGIGCGGLIVIVVLLAVVVGVFFGPQIKQWTGHMEEVANDPDKARATANFMVNMPGGQFEIVAHDEANKRYTVRQKSNGALSTIYWDTKTQKPVVVKGDFSAIPPDANTPGAPSTPEPK